jgi:hypothetical protein
MTEPKWNFSIWNKIMVELAEAGERNEPLEEVLKKYNKTKEETIIFLLERLGI